MKSTSPAQVVFDCDGVMVDSEPLSIQVDRQMLSELGWELSLDEIIELLWAAPTSTSFRRSPTTPAPDLFLHAAKAMGWEPSSCVVVEDSPYGVDAALAAGMWAIAYVGGVTKADRLARPGVTLITDMRDLPTAIAALRGR